jgi:hypothetical protein
MMPTIQATAASWGDANDGQIDQSLQRVRRSERRPNHRRQNHSRGGAALTELPTTVPVTTTCMPSWPGCGYVRQPAHLHRAADQRCLAGVDGRALGHDQPKRTAAQVDVDVHGRAGENRLGEVEHRGRADVADAQRRRDRPPAVAHDLRTGRGQLDRAGRRRRGDRTGRQIGQVRFDLAERTRFQDAGHPIFEFAQRQPALTDGGVQPGHDALAVGVAHP